MIWFIYILSFICNTIAITVLVDGVVIGIALQDFRKRPYTERFLLKNPNRLDFQKSTECAGFSAAHVLRSFGMEAEGNEMYARMPGKLWNGAVLPVMLKRCLKQYRLKVHYRKGSLATVKAELCAGKRIIVFVKTRLDKPWLHYVPVVGYDKEHVYIAESLRDLTNCEETYYNRKLTNKEFQRYWDTRAWYMPFYRNTYLVITPKKNLP